MAARVASQDRRVIVCPLCDMAIPHTGDENVLFEAHVASGACVPKVKTETKDGDAETWGHQEVTIESWDLSTKERQIQLV